MRIAHFTLLGYFNYGQTLQKFALQHTLKKFADSVEVLWRNGGGGNRNHHNNYYDRDYYDRGRGGGFSFRQWFTKKFKKKTPDIKVSWGGKYEKDFNYRQKKQQEEEELNNILDKVKKSGYANLTDDEKRRLFDMSQK